MDFAEYVAARRPSLIRAAVLLGCPRGDAEDLVQTTLTKAYRSWRRVQRADQPDAYVYRILVNAWHDSHRRPREVTTDELPEPAGGPDLADPATTGIAVRRALARMTPDHREVLVLRYYADLSERQISEVLGLPPGTVKSRAARALAALAADHDIVRSP